MIKIEVKNKLLEQLLLEELKKRKNINIIEVYEDSPEELSEIEQTSPYLSNILAKNLAKYGAGYDLTIEDLGKKFKYNMGSVIFNGMSSSKKAVYTKDGKQYKIAARRFAIANGRKPTRD